jgi:uncharacterized membrane protein YkvA (DUF1232 family)
MEMSSLARFARFSAKRPVEALAAAVAVGRNASRIASYTRRLRSGRFTVFAEQVRLATDLLNDVRSGEYRHVPWATVGSLAMAVAYFVMPLDMIPDYVPFSGFVDDAAVMSIVFRAAEQDLRHYLHWRGGDEEVPGS